MRVVPAFAVTAAILLAAPAAPAARGESPAAFDGRCIPAGCVAPPSNIPDILSRRALPPGRGPQRGSRAGGPGRLARLGATPDFHHGLPGAPQPPAAQGHTQQAQKPAAQAPATETPPESYTYQTDGRRDPFLSLLGTGTEPRPTSRRGEGLAGLTLADISVRGIMQSRDALVAMIAGPDNRTYIVHQGDRLLDGTIKSITHEGLVVVQRVTDPLSVVKQREIHKLLRSLEDAKE